jgi:GAF domain-containing protein
MMIEIMSQKLEWHLAAIRLINPQTGRLELAAFKKSGLHPDEIQTEMDRLNQVFSSSNQEGLSGWVVENGKTIRSGDVQADTRYLSTFPEIHSGLYVPLMVGEQAIGSIGVESRQINRFTAEDERLLQTKVEWRLFVPVRKLKVFALLFIRLPSKSCQLKSVSSR